MFTIDQLIAWEILDSRGRPTVAARAILRGGGVGVTQVEMIAAHAGAFGVRLTTELRTGHPAQEILAAARAHRADLIVLGHSGRSGAWGRFLGTTAEKVSRHAECSVLIVR
jgi:nucleotide-binding universal stress UspA family protein